MAELSGPGGWNREDTLRGVRTHFNIFLIFLLETTVQRTGTVSELALISPELSQSEIGGDSLVLDSYPEMLISSHRDGD